MKLYWATDSIPKTAYGYRMHSKKLKEAMVQAGVDVTTDPGTAWDIAVHCGEYWNIKPIPGRLNVLFGQTEIGDIFWGDRGAELDRHLSAIVTSCRSSRATFAKHFKGLIELCPLGVDFSLFRPQERRLPPPDKPLWFLWVNHILEPCKDFGRMVEAWQAWGDKGTRPPNAKLWVKTPFRPDRDPATFIQRGPRPVPTPGIHPSDIPGITIDDRDLPGAELASLYAGSHAFVMASIGEGFGLSVFESLATGLPTIWNHTTALVDFTDESMGFPVTEHELVPSFFGGGTAAMNPGRPADWTAPRATVGALVARMEEVVQDYPAALAKGRVSREKIQHLTWEATARRFAEVCEVILKGG